MRKIKTLLLFICLLPASLSFAQKNDSASKINELENDAHFLVSASEIHMEEISLGQLAQTKASLTDVKELGKMMEAEHTKLLNDLKQLAQHKLFVLPSSPADHSQDAYNNLNEKSPADFDKEYCKMLVSGHEDAIEQFEKASKESTDQEIREWATASLPVLKKHLQHAISCLKKNEKL